MCVFQAYCLASNWLISQLAALSVRICVYRSVYKAFGQVSLLRSFKTKVQQELLFSTKVSLNKRSKLLTIQFASFFQGEFQSWDTEAKFSFQGYIVCRWLRLVFTGQCWGGEGFGASALVQTDLILQHARMHQLNRGSVKLVFRRVLFDMFI